VHKTTDKVLVMEDTPLTGLDLRGDTSSAEKRRRGQNNLRWVYDRYRDYGTQAKFLYVHRPLNEMIASASKNGLSVAAHAEQIVDWAWYIHEEYELISAQSSSNNSSSWAQVEYQWFAANVDHKSTADSCTLLRGAIVEFTEWTDCDIAEACRHLQELKFPAVESKSTASVQLKSEAYNISLPIPFVRYSAR
jgi:hypothetical protein